MMLLTLYAVAILVGIAIAQHPDDWTPSTNEPSSIPVLDCSARDASISALASCTSHWDSSDTNYPDECRNLLFEQGRFHTCTNASPTSSSTISTTKPTYTLMEGSALATLTTTRVVTELVPAPPNMKAAYSYATAPLDNNDAELLGPPYPVFKPGFPRADCPDPDHCYVEFTWRTATWIAEQGICALCKHYESMDWGNLPYNVFPPDMREGLCEKWQPPATYDC